MFGRRSKLKTGCPFPSVPHYLNGVVVRCDKPPIDIPMIMPIEVIHNGEVVDSNGNPINQQKKEMDIHPAVIIGGIILMLAIGSIASTILVTE